MSITPTPSDIDEDFDIYADLADPNVNENLSEDKNDVVKSLKEQVSSLQSENETLRNSNKTLLASNKNLSANISILYKTATEEIKRKDKAIEDLTRELDSYFFRRNGRKPPDRGLKNVNPSIIETLTENSRHQLDGAPTIHSSLTSSERKSKPDNTTFTESSSSSREITINSGKTENALPEAKAEKIIKEVPKKRKVIEYKDVEEKRPVDDGTSDRKVIPPKLSVWDRLGYQGNNPLSSNETSTSVSLNVNEIMETKIKRSIPKLSEKKEDSQQTPCADTSKLSNTNLLIGETLSKQVEPLKSSEVEAPALCLLKAAQSSVVKGTESLQGPRKKEDPACELSQPSLVSNEDRILPKSFVPFQPPLPLGDPLPPPPLPSSTPPPTPVKSIQHEENKITSEIPDLKDTVSTGLISLQDDLCVNSRSNVDITSDDHQESVKNNRPRWSDENLYTQCPFKPRRRAKSVVVIEDADDGDNKINLKSTESLKVETSSRPNKSSDKLKRTPLKKSDNQENRLSSDFRLYQTQRSVHSNRHLSLKSYVHLPERRSPSELLNGRSGRIARISHQDKVRARFRDRRSRSLSPQKKRLREDDHRSKIGQRATGSRDGSRRILTEDYGAKTDKIQDGMKSKSLKKKPTIPKEEGHKPKGKFAELFGESSPEPEEKLSKKTNGDLKSTLSISTSTLKPNPLKEEAPLPAAPLKSSTNIGSKNNMPPEGDVIVIKRRPRSSIKLGNSEDAAHNSRMFSVKTSQQESLSCSTPLSKDGNGASDAGKKSVKPSKAEEQSSKQIVNIATTPLYFRERGVKRSTSDDCALDEDLLGDSEESVTNADSDDTYNPKVSRGKSSKRKPSKRKR